MGGEAADISAFGEYHVENVEVLLIVRLLGSCFTKIRREVERYMIFGFDS